MEELIAALAARITCRYGRKSLAFIAEHCEMAAAIGDQSSLQVWRGIAATAEDLLAMDSTSKSVGPEAPEGLYSGKVIHLDGWTSSARSNASVFVLTGLDAN